MVLRLTRDRIDSRRPERTIVSFAASLILHALAALLLFSLPTSSSEQAQTESFTNNAVVTVTREAPQQPQAVQTQQPVPPAPHATVVPQPRLAARPQSAAPHPRVLHELSKNVPSAAPNPTPAPESSLLAVPAPTQAPQLAASAAPIVAAVPTSVPLSVTAVSVKVPPTAAPQPKPTPVATSAPTRAPAPTAAPTIVPRTPQPEPSPLTATVAPIAGKPLAIVTPSAQASVRVLESQQRGTAPTPGPKTPGSPGPRAVAAVKGPQVAKPIQAPPSSPAPRRVASAVPRKGTLNQRLQSLIPTAGPSVSPEPVKHYHYEINLRVTPEPQPTPPPEVLAATKFTYEENVAAQRWKQSYLGTAPEEAYVKMYVTGIKRIGFIKWCTGWVVRAPIAGSAKWIVEPDESFICAGHLEPFTPPSPEPSTGP